MVPILLVIVAPVVALVDVHAPRASVTSHFSGIYVLEEACFRSLTRQPSDSAFPPCWLLATNHKTGTHLVTQLVTAHNDFVQSGNLSRHKNFDKGHYSSLVMAAGVNDYKLVNIIRDPIETTISGYWYHLDNANVSHVGTGPAKLGPLSTAEGLNLEAAREYASTLHTIDDVLKATGEDSKSLNIGLESFDDDFNATVRCIFGFFHGHDDMQLQALVDAVQFADKGRWRDDPGLRAEAARHGRPNRQPIHTNSRKNKEAARRLIAESTDPVWDKLRSLRTSWGYTRQGKSGQFRRPLPRQCA